MKPDDLIGTVWFHFIEEQHFIVLSKRECIPNVGPQIILCGFDVLFEDGSFTWYEEGYLTTAIDIDGDYDVARITGLGR